MRVPYGIQTIKCRTYLRHAYALLGSLTRIMKRLSQNSLRPRNRATRPIQIREAAEPGCPPRFQWLRKAAVGAGLRKLSQNCRLVEGRGTNSPHPARLHVRRTQAGLRPAPTDHRATILAFPENAATVSKLPGYYRTVPTGRRSKTLRQCMCLLILAGPGRGSPKRADWGARELPGPRTRTDRFQSAA